MKRVDESLSLNELYKKLSNKPVREINIAALCIDKYGNIQSEKDSKEVKP